MKKITVWFVWVALMGMIQAADLPPELENYLLRLADHELSDDLVRGLEALYRHPPMLSRMTLDQVSLLFFLNEDQQHYILIHHPMTPQILEKEGIIQDSIKLRLLGILSREGTVSRRLPKQPYRIEMSGRIKTRYPEIPDSSFEGDNFNHSLDLEMTHGAWRCFGICDKDYQEKNRLDFINAGIRYQINPRQHLIVGGYQVNWQQGLVIRQGFSFDYLIDDPLLIRKTGSRLDLYTGSSVNQGFRGIGWQAEFLPLRIQVVGSHRSYDASLNSDGQITSPVESGYHRNSLEKSKKNSLTENLVGMMAELDYGDLRLSSAVYMAGYDPAFVEADSARQDARMTGDQNRAGALSLSWNNQAGWGLFSEWGMVKSGSIGMLSGGWIRLHEYRASMMTRYYGVDYRNLHSGAFSYRDRNQNEKGIICAVQRCWKKKTELSGVVDLYRSLDRTYTSLFPIQASIFQLRMRHRAFECMGQYRENRDYSSSEWREIIQRDGYCRITVNWRFNPHDQWSARLEYKRVSLENQPIIDGWLVSIRNSRYLNKFNLSFQLLWFNTDSYESRIYIYCKELPGLWSVPAFYGRGGHAYFLPAYKTKKWLMAFKAAATYYPTTRSLSDGRNGQWFQEYGLYIQKNLEW